MEKYKINYVLCTYAGIYSRKFSNSIIRNQNPKLYLRYHLAILNSLKINLDQITIMKPRVNEEHTIIDNYYDYDEFTNIKNIIKIIECENIACSYGQFYQYIYKESINFDYYIFMEYDYIPFIDNFDYSLINFYNNYNEDIFLCAGILKTNYGYMTRTFKNDVFNIPDFSLGIINKKCIMKIRNTFTLNEIISFSSVIYDENQIIFGYVLNKSIINIKDFVLIIYLYFMKIYIIVIIF